MLFSKSTLVTGTGLNIDDKNSLTDNTGSYYRTPTPEEYAKNLGINTEVDTSKLGKVGKLSDLDDNDDDDWKGGQGFLWSI